MILLSKIEILEAIAFDFNFGIVPAKKDTELYLLYTIKVILK